MPATIAAATSATRRQIEGRSLEVIAAALLRLQEMSIVIAHERRSVALT